MQMGDDRTGRGGVGDAQADWTPPFFSDDEAVGDRGGRYDTPYGAHGSAARPAVSWYVPFAGRLLTVMAIGMLLFALVGGLFGVTTTKSTSSSQAVLVTTTNPVVHITSAVGVIRVVPIPVGDMAKANAVTVEAVTEVRHISPFLAERNLDGAQITPTIGENGEVYIDTQTDGGGDFLFERSTSATIYVPQGTALDLNVQFGSANVTGLSGPMTIEVSGGNLNLVDLMLGDGSRLQLNGGNANLADVSLNGRIDLRVNGGNIDLDGILGTNTSLNVEVNGGFADVRLPLNSAARLDAIADGGSLNINGWTGEVTRTDRNSGNQRLSGYLSADTATTNRITLQLDGGGITLRPQSTNSPPPAPATPAAPVAPPAPPERPGVP